MTGRAYLGEVLNKFGQEMSELLDRQVNAQKEKTSGVHGSSCEPTKKVCDENKRNKQRNKKTMRT